MVRAIGERLADLGADPVAVDAARHLRVPGSLHAVAEREVEWQIHGSGSRVHSYSLKELAAFFQIKPTQRSPNESKILAPKARTERWRGHRQAAANKLKAFLCLRDMRGGGFSAGTRNNAAHLYALILRGAQASREETLQQVVAMGRACKPALREAECANKVKYVYKQKFSKLKYATMAENLGITPAEAEIISKTIGKHFPAAAKFGRTREIGPAPSTRKQDRETRLAAISAVANACGSVS